MKNLLFISIILLLTSCFEPDEILPKASNETLEIEIDLLKNQASFLDLHNIRTSSNTEFKDWQLKFQNDQNGWAIYLNTLSKVAVSNTRITRYDSIKNSYNTGEIDWQVDIPTNTGVYPAIGPWGDFSFETPESYKDVYLIRWLKDGKEKIYKLQILDARKGAYHIRYGTLDETFTNSVWIEKQNNKQHSYFSLALDQVLSNVEPPNNQWNVCFTYLTDSIAKHPKLPFISTANNSFGIYQGLIINRANSTVYIDTLRSLEEINYFNSNALQYRSIDELYNVFSEWDTETESHVLNETAIMIVKDDENLFAIKPKWFRRTLLSSFSLQLEIKKL